MKKKLIGIVLAVAMVVCMLPVVASADTDPVVKLVGIELKDGKTDKTTSGFESIIESGSVYYDEASKTLTLDSVVCTGTDDFVRAENVDLNVCIKGENKYTLTAEADGVSVHLGDVKISGDGSLLMNLDESSDAIVADNIVVEGTSTINITKCNFGLIAGNDISISGAPQITINADGYGIVSDTGVINIALSEGGKISASSKEAFALLAYGITLADNNTITEPVNGKVGRYKESPMTIITADGNYVQTAVIEGPTKKVGADTGDANNIALFAIMGVLALAGAGVAMKKREN